MKNIRQNVFETNSSSTHSVSINANTDGIYDTIIPLDNGVITLIGGEFGWEWRQINDTLTKANYAAVYARDDEKLTNMLTNVIKDHTGAKEVIYDLDEYSYIDHQSDKHEGGECGYAFATNQSLKDFIFSPNSWLFTGNDNEEAPPNFYDVDTNVSFKYKLYLEKYSDTPLKLKDIPNTEDLKEKLKELYRYCVRDYKYIATEYERLMDNSVLDSFTKINENIITVYHLDFVKDGKNFKRKLISSKDLKFILEEI